MTVPDATSLVALLQQEVPRAVFEAAPTVESVLAAIKAGHVSVVSRPLTLTRCASILAQHTVGAARERARSWWRPNTPSPQTILTPR